MRIFVSLFQAEAAGRQVRRKESAALRVSLLSFHSLMPSVSATSKVCLKQYDSTNSLVLSSPMSAADSSLLLRAFGFALKSLTST